MPPISGTHLTPEQWMSNREQNQSGRNMDFIHNYGLWKYVFRLPPLARRIPTVLSNTKAEGQIMDSARHLLPAELSWCSSRAHHYPPARQGSQFAAQHAVPILKSILEEAAYDQVLIHKNQWGSSNLRTASILSLQLRNHTSERIVPYPILKSFWTMFSVVTEWC